MAEDAGRTGKASRSARLFAGRKQNDFADDSRRRRSPRILGSGFYEPRRSTLNVSVRAISNDRSVVKLFFHVYDLNTPRLPLASFGERCRCCQGCEDLKMTVADDRFFHARVTQRVDFEPDL